VECGSNLVRKKASGKAKNKQNAKSAQKKKTESLNSYVYIAGVFIVALVIVLLILNDNRSILMDKIAQSKGGGKRNATAQEAPAEAMAQVRTLKDKLEQNPQDTQSAVQLANLYFDVGKFNQAIGYYKQALENDPANTAVLIDLGVSYFNLNQADSAVIYMKKALQVQPDHKQGLYNIGIVYYNINQFDKAIAYWEQLIKTHPESQEAQNAKSFIEQVRSQANM